MSEDEPNIIKEFRSLYDYVCLLGKHINTIHEQLETIERSIEDINLNHSNFVRENSAEIRDIRENMVEKQEFNEFIEKMKTSMSEILPPLPTLTQEAPILREQEESSEETIMQ